MNARELEPTLIAVLLYYHNNVINSVVRWVIFHAAAI